jgi:hypothetical protein
MLVLMAGDGFAGEWINQRLPSWISIDGQLRHRYEWRSDSDFNKAIDDDKGYSLWRSKLAMTLKPSNHLKLYYQIQDSRISRDSISGSKVTYENWFDTQQAWFQVDWPLGDSAGKSKMGLKLGRQEFSYGAQRLLGKVDWTNVSTTFDAIKGIWEIPDKKILLEVFGGGKTLVKSPREADDFYEGSDNDRLGGYYLVYTQYEPWVIEQYLLNRNTEGKTVSFGHQGDGEVDDYTLGMRLLRKAKAGVFDYELETATQFGKSGSLDVNAQMLVVIAGYTFDYLWKPRLAIEIDYATGDRDKSDELRRTFDNIYGVNHSFYGYMDFIGLQNIIDYRLQAQLNPSRKVNLSADYHYFYLDTPKDHLYGANKAIKRSTVNGARDHVGSEIDLLSKYQITNNVLMMVGYSHFFAGAFLRDTGSANDADFVYVQSVLAF